MLKYKFECGCTFPLEKEREGKLPLLDMHPDNFPINCPAVWKLFGEGRTKGIFQLESQLGTTWSKKLKPENIEHLGALVAILRPGVLKCISEETGSSLTKQYCDRKNGLEEITYKYPILEPILRKTYGVMIYQEQMLKIAEAFADFDLLEQDQLRKAAGKKSMELMAKMGIIFVEKAVKKGILTKEQAEVVFDDIKKSGRYLFNKSHAISYAVKAYKTAYEKAHVAGWFFSSWLKNAHGDSNPREEIMELVQDSKQFPIKVETPDVLSLASTLSSDGEVIKFGLSDARDVGEKQVQLLIKAINDLDKPIEELTWEDFLYFAADNPNSKAMKSWICCGAFKWTGLARNRLLKEYEGWVDLTDKEKEWVRINAKDVKFNEALKLVGRIRKEGGGCHTAARAVIVNSMALMLDSQNSLNEDHPNQIVDMEEYYLGVPISCSRMDSVDNSMANTTCAEFLAGKAGNMYLAVEVKGCRSFKTKKGDEMAFASVADETGNMPDVCIFPKVWSSIKSLFKEKNTVLIQGIRDKEKDSFILNKAFQL